MAEIKSCGEWWEVREPVAFHRDELLTEVFIYGDIGEDIFEGTVSAKDFVEELQNIGPGKINVHINSFGGSVADGLAIYNAMKRHHASVYTYNDGVCMSVASLILMGGEVVNAADNSLTMIHAPWVIAAGNAVEFREKAEMLDTFAKAMASAYARNGIDPEYIMSMLTDGKDHVFTADEALKIGLIDNITVPVKVAAKYRSNRFTTNNTVADNDKCGQLITTKTAAIPAAKPKVEDSQMSDENPSAPKAAEPVNDNVIDIKAAAVAAAKADIVARNNRLSTIKSFTQDQRVRDLADTFIMNPDGTLDEFYDLAADIRGAGIEPINQPRAEHVEPGLDSRDKMRKGVKSAISARLRAAEDDRANEYRGLSLVEMAKEVLSSEGVHVRGMSRRDIAAHVFAAKQTSDFPLLLADSLNKRLQSAYEEAPRTWREWCSIGQVPDFKAAKLLRMGSFSTLATKAELAAYTEGDFSEEQETATAVTKGKMIGFSREMFINDDLNSLERKTRMMGSAAGRTVEKDVYTTLTGNPVMTDTNNLFSVAHANVGTAGAMSVTTIDELDKLLGMQQDPSGNDYLDLMPSVLLVPRALKSAGNIIVSSASHPDFSNSRKANPVEGIAKVVASPWLDAVSETAFYLLASPQDAPLMEVLFLDGNEAPFIDEQEVFLTDELQWKVRLDYAVAANDWRGGAYNAGA